MSLAKHIGESESNKVCRLKKALYGLRGSPRIWYNLLSNDLMDIGLKPSPSVPCVFVDNGVIEIYYVDDLLPLRSDKEQLGKLQDQLPAKVHANDLGKASDFWG